MTDNPDDRHGPPGRFASPQCLMHELHTDALGFASEADPQTLIDVMRWRRTERARLIAARINIDPAERARMAAQIVIALDALLGEIAGRTIAGYWPICGQLDLRPWMERVVARGGVCALPVVVRRNAPVEFRAWHSGSPLERDVVNIPVPSSRGTVTPDIVIAPLVGFDTTAIALETAAGTTIGRWPRFRVGRAPSAWALREDPYL